MQYVDGTDECGDIQTKQWDQVAEPEVTFLLQSSK